MFSQSISLKTFITCSQKLTRSQFSLYTARKDNEKKTKTEKPFSSPESVKAGRIKLVFGFMHEKSMPTTERGRERGREREREGGGGRDIVGRTLVQN